MRLLAYCGKKFNKNNAKREKQGEKCYCSQNFNLHNSWIEKKKSENRVTQIFYAPTIFIIPLLSFHLNYIDLPKLTEQQNRPSCISYADGNFNVNVKLGLKV